MRNRAQSASQTFLASATQVWRAHGLARLYTAFLLYVLSDAMNPVKRTFSFEYWYIVYFHDIQLWEGKHRTGTLFSTGF